MSSPPTAAQQPVYRCAVLSVVKHAYVPRGVAAHPQFTLVVVADDNFPTADSTTDRNQILVFEIQP